MMTQDTSVSLKNALDEIRLHTCSLLDALSMSRYVSAWAILSHCGDRGES
jgi:hypothetical protein